jgi:DNA-binding NarL/FixJ family response regulator
LLPTVDLGTTFVPARRLPRVEAVVLAHTILIADDSELIRRTLRIYIEQHTDWSVCGEAENGKIAVEKVTALQPNMLILDFQMPVMNGLDAAREISQLSPGTIVVMLTMHYGAELLTQAQAAGVRDVLSKSDHLAGRLLASLRSASARS